ncbi:hypothetical protein EJ04DRAFT_594510 [Polyplosphaeria fusca]|uniref:Uncharacterized protein n=1 Tax=Polyplosphaeria fusca TaxID=682080 RepID=A0A9P4V3T2_9PLEO|nr:hypothetical protein EJ04DRAFT_594510 [Polyplosphaeria fusca]
MVLTQKADWWLRIQSSFLVLSRTVSFCNSTWSFAALEKSLDTAMPVPNEDKHTIKGVAPDVKAIFPILRLPNELIGCVIEHIIGPVAYFNLCQTEITEPFPAECNSPYPPSAMNQSCTPGIVAGRNLCDMSGRPIIKYLPKSENAFIRSETELQLWQHTMKRFKDPFTMAATHLATRSDWPLPLTKLWNRSFKQHKLIPLAWNKTVSPGILDRVELDFSIDGFLQFFDVKVPPFDDPDLVFWHGKERGRCGAAFLQHTKELALVFGGTFLWDNPWTNADAVEADLCRLGGIPDLLLSFAWLRIRHIPVIRLEGNMQPWVRDLWQSRIDGDRNFKPDLQVLMTIGVREAETKDQDYDWQDHYPPRCQCKRSCQELVRSILGEE